MKLSRNWLNRHVNIQGIETKEISEKLTLHTAEVEEVETKYDLLNNIIAVKVEKIEDHPNADKLKVAKISDGKVRYQIVFGAPNCR